MNIEEKIRELIEQEVTAKNYIISDIIYENEDGNNFLRIIIDKDGVVNLDDCVLVTEIVNPILDKHDPIEEQYILDISSKEKGSN